jgi:LacI family transcriptional regulator
MSDIAPPAGIRDVAERAGVSVATVSNVINRPEVVAPATRRRVEEAIAALGYVRNESARQLRVGHSRTIGLIVPDIANPFFTDVARGVEDTTSAAGALVIVGNSDDDPEKEHRYLTLFAEQQVQGALVVPVRGSEAATGLLRRRGIPVVMLDSTDTTTDSCSVSVNDVVGGRLAVAHLAASGHRRIGFVGSASVAPQVIDRLAGARLAMVNAGRSPEDLVTLGGSPLNVAGGALAAAELLSLPARRRPSAIACVNDLLALGALYELLRRGVRVPDDIAIVGYDDIGFAESAAVPLSSVRQPRQHLGARAAELLLEESGGAPHTHDHVVFEPELVVRASSGSRTRRGPTREATGG